MDINEASIIRLAEATSYLDDVTMTVAENRTRIADILTHVVHARDGLITGTELLLKLSKTLDAPFYDIAGRPYLDGRDKD